MLLERGVGRIVLVTYISALLRNTDGTTPTAGYLWVWGLGGLIGCLGIGFLIDRWRDTRGCRA